MAQDLGVSKMCLVKWMRRLGLGPIVGEIRRRATARFRLPTLEEFDAAAEAASRERGIRG